MQDNRIIVQIEVAEGKDKDRVIEAISETLSSKNLGRIQIWGTFNACVPDIARKYLKEVAGPFLELLK